jgi:4-hydroxybenzoyl-CoA thioesterase
MGKTFIKPQKIKFAHCDAAGIVFYPRYFEMLNELVEDWFEEALDLPFSKLHDGEGVPTVDIKIKFRKASRLGTLFTKKLWLTRLGTSSATYGFQFVDGETIYLEGEATIVHVTLSDKELKSQAWEKKMRIKMEEFLM